VKSSKILHHRRLIHGLHVCVAGCHWQELGQVLAGQKQDKQEEQGVQEQTCWGCHALGAGHPVACDGAHQLEGLWAGSDGESNTWNNKLGHFIFAKKLIGYSVDDAVFLKMLIIGIIRIVTRLKGHAAFGHITRFPKLGHDKSNDNHEDECMEKQTSVAGKPGVVCDPVACDAPNRLEGGGICKHHKRDKRNQVVYECHLNIGLEFSPGPKDLSPSV